MEHSVPMSRCSICGAPSLRSPPRSPLSGGFAPSRDSSNQDQGSHSALPPAAGEPRPIGPAPPAGRPWAGKRKAMHAGCLVPPLRDQPGLRRLQAGCMRGPHNRACNVTASPSWGASPRIPNMCLSQFPAREPCWPWLHMLHACACWVAVAQAPALPPARPPSQNVLFYFYPRLFLPGRFLHVASCRSLGVLAGFLSAGWDMGYARDGMCIWWSCASNVVCVRVMSSSLGAQYRRPGPVGRPATS